jgi:hypothetical protein
MAVCNPVRRVALAVVGALCMLVFVALPRAEAATWEGYCGPQYVSGYERCPTSSTKHSWETNDSISNQGAWPMCERMEYWYDGSSIYSRNCANKIDVAGYWDDYCGGCHGHVNNGTYLRCWAGNNTQFTGNLSGTAAYNVF